MEHGLIFYIQIDAIVRKLYVKDQAMLHRFHVVNFFFSIINIFQGKCTNKGLNNNFRQQGGSMLSKM